MRMLNLDNDKPINNLSLYLTPQEADQLLYDLQQLIKAPDKNHAHLYDDAYEREIIFSIYRPENVEHYDERSRRLIEHNE